MDNLIDKLKELEKTPTSILKDITPAKPVDVNELLNHTGAPIFNPVQGQTNPQGQIIPPLNSDGSNQPQRMNVGNLLTPDMAVGFFNIILPAVMVIIFKRAGKLTAKAQFEASAKEQEIIKPVLAKYLESINFTVETPFTALILTVGFIYGSKCIEVLNNAPKGSIKTTDFKAPMATTKIVDNITKVRKARPKGMTYNKNKGYVQSEH